MARIMADPSRARRGFSRSVLLPAFGLALASLLLGTASNLVSPRRIPWVEDWSQYIESKALREGITLVTTPQAVDYFRRGTHVFLDARHEADYQKARIPGAFSLPFDAMEEKAGDVQLLLSPSQPVVTYCSGKNCDESFLLTVELRKQGFTNVVLYAGGMDAWIASGHPAERGP